MSAAPLIDALRRKAKDDVDALWRKARADADEVQATLARAYEEQRIAAAQQLASKSAGFVRAATIQAEGTARKHVATAKAALADRLRRLAIDALPALRNAQLLPALAAELPTRTWRRVRVHPEDRAAAQSLFPKADVIADAVIAGGLDVEEGPVRIGNTLEARLESAWPEILPGLMKEILEEVSHS